MLITGNDMRLLSIFPVFSETVWRRLRVLLLVWGQLMRRRYRH